jgi:SAM-dependent methyltransferase
MAARVINRDFKGQLGLWLARALGQPTAADYTRKCLEASTCKLALDIGCGVSSHLTKFRPEVRTIGMDVDMASIEAARSRDAHDDYIVADIVRLSPQELQAVVAEKIGDSKFDLVAAYGVVEHLPKKDGWAFIDKCESLSSKYVIFEAPNGFVEQGPEFGNPFQRHLSGWFPQDFEGLGYKVYGTCGTKYLRGYMGEPRIHLPGILLFDLVVLSRMARAGKLPSRAFNIVAIKDVRGVAARYESRCAPRAGRAVA